MAMDQHLYLKEKARRLVADEFKPAKKNKEVFAWALIIALIVCLFNMHQYT
jgi:hypothetical protein